jgi:hypothetical protein
MLTGPLLAYLVSGTMGWAPVVELPNHTGINQQ